MTLKFKMLILIIIPKNYNQNVYGILKFVIIPALKAKMEGREIDLQGELKQLEEEQHAKRKARRN